MCLRERDEDVDILGVVLHLMLDVTLDITLEAQAAKGNSKA